MTVCAAVLLLAHSSVYFESNLGQADARAVLLANTTHYGALFTNEGVELRDAKGIVRLVFTGARKPLKVEGIHQQAGRVNYLRGSDPSRWVRRATTFEAVLYREVYPGIDFKIYGNDAALEYDWIIQPGADPRQIRMQIPGVEFDRDGSLLSRTGSGAFRHQAPSIHQHGRKIRGRFIRRGRDTVSFEIGDYDRQQVLVIDPVLTYATYASVEFGRTLAVRADRAGNFYVTGYTGTNGRDAFAAKYDPTGKLVYFTTLGGLMIEEGKALAVTTDGSLLVTGWTASADFPTSKGAYLESPGTRGPLDWAKVFVSKLSPEGDQLTYSTLLGGEYDDSAWGIAVDGTGRAHIAGVAASGSFPVTDDALQPALPSRYFFNGFLTRLNAEGTKIEYSTFLGGLAGAEARAVEVDESGYVYVAGTTYSPDFLSPAQPRRRWGGVGAYRFNGTSWESIPEITRARAVTFHPLDPSTVVIASLGKVFKSTDGGFSWAPKPVADPDGEVLDVVFDPSKPATVYAIVDGGLAKSEDGGESWNRYSMGFHPTKLLIAASDSNLMLAEQAGRLFRSQDAGQRWRPMPDIEYDGALLCADPSSPSTFYVSQSTGPRIGLYRTTDAGLSWRRISNIPFYSLTVDPTDPSILYTGYDRSTDGGQTWERSRGLSGRITSLVLDRATPGRLFASTLLGAFQSTDGGLTWTPLKEGLRTLSLSGIGVHQVNPGPPIAIADTRSDGFVVKIDPRGSLVWQTFIGGGGADRIEAMKLGRDGSVYVAGYTESIDLPVTEGAFQPHYSGSTDGFVMRIGPEESIPAMSTYFGGERVDRLYAIDVDEDGRIVVGGGSVSDTFPTTADAPFPKYQGVFEFAGPWESVFSVLNADATSLEFSTFLPMDGSQSQGVAAGPAQRFGHVGYTLSSTLPITADAAQPRPSAGYFVIWDLGARNRATETRERRRQ